MLVGFQCYVTTKDRKIYTEGVGCLFRLSKSK